jgi:hypothetical protein
MRQKWRPFLRPVKNGAEAMRDTGESRSTFTLLLLSCEFLRIGIRFKLMLDITHPKRGDTLQLPLMADFTTDPIKTKPPRDDAKQGSLFGDGPAN